MAIPFGALYRRKSSGVPYWFRPKMYTSVVRPYSGKKFQTYVAFGRQITLMLAGGWFFAHRYTDYSELLDEDYNRGKVMLAAEYKHD